MTIINNKPLSHAVLLCTKLLTDISVVKHKINKLNIMSFMKMILRNNFTNEK